MESHGLIDAHAFRVLLQRKCFTNSQIYYKRERSHDLMKKQVLASYKLLTKQCCMRTIDHLVLNHSE